MPFSADTLLGTLTVAEMLMYTAELKCEMSEPRASKAERVEKLLDDLNLQVRRALQEGSCRGLGAERYSRGRTISPPAAGTGLWVRVHIQGLAQRSQSRHDAAA